MALIVATLLASCNKDEDMYGETGNRVPVTFSATIDTGSLARANSSADDPVSRCLMEVVETVEGEPKTSYGVQSMTDMSNGQYALSGVMLNPNKEYTFLFWADGGDNHYTADDLTAIGIAADAREAGIAYRAKKEWSGDKSISVTLTHAVTKVSLTSTTSVPSAQTVTLSGLTEYKGYNVMSDSPAGETTGFTHSATGKGQAGDVFSFYAIVTDETQDLTLNAGGRDVAVNSVPLGQNKHIILRGDVANAGFTEVTFTASIDNSWGNTGTEYIDDYIIDSTGTYIVYTYEGLMKWAEAVQTNLSLSCTLAADITMPTVGEGESNWTSIGSSAQSGLSGIYYSGTFDGGNHTITGLTINSGSEGEGLIGALKGTVKNLTLKDVNIKGYNLVGGVVGCNWGIIENCSVSGVISGNIPVGGIAGYLVTGSIKACYSTANVSGNGEVGGIVGFIYDGSVIACYSSGVMSETNSTGGIIGKNSGYGPITACYWSNYEGPGVGNGTGETTKVDGTDVTWIDAQEGMNAALSDYEWQYVGANATTPPTLSKK